MKSSYLKPLALVTFLASLVTFFILLLHNNDGSKLALLTCGVVVIASLTVVVATFLIATTIADYSKPGANHLSGNDTVVGSDPGILESNNTDVLHERDPGALQSDNSDASRGCDPVDDKRWLKLVEEDVELFGELDRHKMHFDAPRQELADHVMCRLQELLERSGVEAIAEEPTFDMHRHQPEKTGVKATPGAMIAETLSPGFCVGRRVFRRARVRLADCAPVESNSI